MVQAHVLQDGWDEFMRDMRPVEGRCATCRQGNNSSAIWSQTNLKHRGALEGYRSKLNSKYKENCKQQKS